MAGYKVSYKLLHAQGGELKAAAKLLDGYAERVRQINGRLGSDNMLAPVRSNLQKLAAQLGESRGVLNNAGELLSKTVERYSGAETRQVKKVDAMKAHNRDFYKNPIVVASAGTAGGAAAVPPAAGAAPPPVINTTVNVTQNTVNIYNNIPADTAAPAADFIPAAIDIAPAAEIPVDTSTAGIAAGVLGGSAAVAGAVAAGMHLKKKRAQAAQASEDGGYRPEAELEQAIQRVRDLEDGET